MKLRGIFEVLPFTNPNGSTSWRVTGTKHDGARVRENFKTEGEAKGRRSELEIAAGNGDTSTRITATRLTAEQIADADCAFTLLKERKVSLTQAAQFYLDNWREPVTAKLLADASADFLKHKKTKNKREDSLRNLRGRLGWLEKRLPGRNVGSITTDELRDFLDRTGVSERTRNNDRAAWHNFFAWARKQKYCAANPVTPIEAYEVDGGDPEIMSVDECKKLLNAALAYKDGKCFPYVALGLFAGLRPDKELNRISWDNINLNRRLIVVEGKAAKRRMRRTVSITKTLAEMLRPFAGSTTIKGKNWRKDFSRVKRAAGFKGDIMTLRKGETQDHLREWPQDIMRHTAISMHLEKHKDEGATALWAGNSPEVIHDKYKGLIKKPADVRAFWKITVTVPKGRKIISLKDAA